MAGLPVAPALRQLHYAPTRVTGLAGLAALTALGIVAVRRTGAVNTNTLPWLALGGWSATYALVTGWTRGGLPIGALHDPRFAYLAVQLWVALVGLGAVLLSGDRERTNPAGLPPRLLHAAIAIVLVGYAVASLRPFLAPGGIGRFSTTLTTGRACLLRYQTADDACLEQLHPSAAKVRAIAARLDARGAAFLRQGTPQSEAAQREQRHAVSQNDRRTQRDPEDASGRLATN